MAKYLTEDIIPSLKEKVSKLYTGYGTNTDGAVTQNFISSKLNSTSVVIGSNSTASGAVTIAIGNSATAFGDGSIAMGQFAQSNSNNTLGVVIGADANASKDHAVAIGYSASSSQAGSIALGSGANPTRAGELNVGTSSTLAVTNGFQGTQYRVIGGVHPGVQDNDAVTVGQLNEKVGDIDTILQQYNTGSGV